MNKNRKVLDFGEKTFFYQPFIQKVNLMPVEVKLRKNEPVDRALRRLKKKVDREEIILTARKNRYYEKPSEKRRQKKKVAKFNNMLRLRYQNM